MQNTSRYFWTYVRVFTLLNTFKYFLSEIQDVLMTIDKFRSFR